MHRTTSLDYAIRNVIGYPAAHACQEELAALKAKLRDVEAENAKLRETVALLTPGSH